MCYFIIKMRRCSSNQRLL